MAISERLKSYLGLLMTHTFGHAELDKIALLFQLDPTKTTIRDRCDRFVSEIQDDRFYELAEYVLNFEQFGSYDMGLREMRKAFARALTMNGFKTTCDSAKEIYDVEPQNGLEQLERQKSETKTLLTERGFKEVQIDLDSAETHYIKANTLSVSQWQEKHWKTCSHQ